MSIKPVGDLTMNHLEERGNDMIQVRSNSDFSVNFLLSSFTLLSITPNPTVGSSCNLTCRFRSSGRICDIGQNRLYEFCYLLPFDLWTFYLAMILFLQGCDSLFWESLSSTKIFNRLQHSFQVWQWFINVSESFSYKNSFFILVTTRKEDFKINSTFKSDFLVYLELLNGDELTQKLNFAMLLVWHHW